MLINYFIEKGEKESTGKAETMPTKKTNDKNQRIRVNDKTASGGWF